MFLIESLQIILLTVSRFIMIPWRKKTVFELTEFKKMSKVW